MGRNTDRSTGELCKAGLEHVDRDGRGACALTEDSNLRLVATERADVRLNPLECHELIFQAEVQSALPNCF
jgi:hypothetical protein